MDKIKAIVIGMLILGMVMGAATTVVAMDQGDEAPKTQEQTRDNQRNCTMEHEYNRERPNGVGDNSPKDR